MDANLPILHSKLTDLLLSSDNSSPRRRRLCLAVEFAQDARDGHRFVIAAAMLGPECLLIRPNPLNSAQLTARADRQSSWARFIRNSTCDTIRHIVCITYICLIFFEPACTTCDHSLMQTLIVEALIVFVLCIDTALQAVDLGATRFVEKRSILILIGVLFVAAVDVLVALSLYPIPVMRFSRPLRVLVPIVLNKPLRRFSIVVVRTIPNIAHLVGCMLVILAAYAVSGVALFKNGLYNDPSEIPFSSIQNFNNLPNAVVALLVLTTTENFPDIYLPGLHEQPIVATIFFLSFFVIGAWLFMSLVLAETYRCYRDQHTAKVSHDRSKEQRSLFCCYQMLTENSAHAVLDQSTFVAFLKELDPKLSVEHRLVLFNLLDKNQNNNIELREFMSLVEIFRYRITEVWDPVARGNEWAEWRQVLRGGCRWALTITSSRSFELACLVVNVGNAAVLLSFASDLYSFKLHVMTWMFLGVMWLDMSLVIGSKGLPEVWQDRPLDLLLLSVSIPAEIFLWGSALTFSRSLRIMRILPIWGKTRPLVETVRTSSAILWQFLFVLVAIFFFFSTIGVELFSEQAIGHPHVDPVKDEVFDTFLQACLALFQLSTSNNWQNNLYSTVLDTSLFSSLFFIVFYFFVNTVIINVFAANLISAYALRRSGRTQIVRRGHSKFMVVVRHPWEREIVSDEMPAFNATEVASLKTYVDDMELQIQLMYQENEHLRMRPVDWQT